MKKLTFMNIKKEDILDREEMRNVMAGCGGSSGECDLYCGNGHILSCGVEPCRIANDTLYCNGSSYNCGSVIW
jgi:hypothetical protein